MKKYAMLLLSLLLVSVISGCANSTTEDTEPKMDGDTKKTEDSLSTIRINDWTKEIVSDKPANTQIRYYIVNEEGEEETMLEVSNMAEEHDIDGDGASEIIEYLSRDYSSIGIYDVIENKVKYLDVNAELNATWSQYMGLMGNIQSQYSNGIEVGFTEQDGTQRVEAYGYRDGALEYLCPFDEALR